MFPRLSPIDTGRSNSVRNHNEASKRESAAVRVNEFLYEAHDFAKVSSRGKGKYI